MRTVLGIDCGTQSTKVLVYDPEKRRVVARAQAPHELISDNAGKREQKAEWWLAALKKCMQQIPLKTKESVVAIGISGQQHGFVPLDKEGKVLYPVKLWCDTSTAVECDEITQSYGGRERLLKDIGNLILPGYTASKVLWFKKNQPALYRKLQTILLPHDYLNFYLTGRRVTEYGDASGTGFLNIRKRAWSEDLVGVLDGSKDLAACLPPLIEPHQSAGTLTKEAARALGLKSGLLVSSGGGDNMMGAIGTGTNTDGSLTVSLGTSGTIYGFSRKPLIDPEGNLAAFCSSSGGWLPLLCTMNCTVATEVTRDLLKANLVKMERLATKATAGSDGVITLPFFNGERTPNLPNGRGCLIGLTPENYKPHNLLRSAMESGIFGLKLGLESFSNLGFTAVDIKLIGGGSKSRIWRQMAADIFDLPVVCPEEEEAAAFGAALQSLWALQTGSNGHGADLNQILATHVKLSKTKRHTPNPEAVRAYEQVYAAYKKYVELLTPAFV